MPKIYISYRRDDSAGVTRLLARKLKWVFGTESILLDVDTISSGVNFRDHINRAVGECDILLAVIGHYWIKSADEYSGRRYIDIPTDLVRLEIESALNRDIPVVPVLVDNARMPRKEDLPKSLHGLAYLSAVELRTDRRWQYEINILIRGIQLLSQSQRYETYSHLSGPIVSYYEKPYEKPYEEPYDELDEVNLGVSMPPIVAPSESFVARFAAYTDAYRQDIRDKLELEAPTSQPRLDLDRCRWHCNTSVEVRLQSDTARVLDTVQSFLWNGAWKILRFDVETFDNPLTQTIILKFDVAVEGLPIISLRPEIQVQAKGQLTASKVVDVFMEQSAPQTAFASYATRDRREVLSRIRSLQIFTNINVFVNCLSLHPGDRWKPKLHEEICNRDIFWLFWSRRARESEWVDWEWRTALDLKTLNGIQPHPLEPVELAPPPDELSDLQFGTLYEWHTLGLRRNWISRLVRSNSHRIALLIGKVLRLMGTRDRPIVRLTVLTLVVIMIIAVCLLAYSLIGS